MIHLHIERLVLDGVAVAPGDSPRLQVAVERELTRLIRERGLAPGMSTGGAVDAVRGGEVRLEPKGSPAKLGRQVASAVYGGIGK